MRFGQPLLPLRRERRPGHKYQQQTPSDHIENLERYLSITSSLVPRDPSQSFLHPPSSRIAGRRTVPRSRAGMFPYLFSYTSLL